MRCPALSALAILGALNGCAIHQTVQAVPALADKAICIIENPLLKDGFLDTYRKALVAKGYTTTLVPMETSRDHCPLMTTYTAGWNWDVVRYLAFAEIVVYRRGHPVGNAKYDALGGGANLARKFINAEEKITELTNQLFAEPARQ